MSVFNQFRFSYDDPSKLGIELTDHDPQKKDYENLKSLMMNSVKITEDIFPEINQSIEKVISKLNISNHFNFFITSDHSQANASCMSTPGSGSAEIIFTSKLIELLNIKELEFVIAHEISHFYFKHANYPPPENAKNRVEFLNYLGFSRFAEISSDRIGFLGTDEINIALKAMFKLMTGLGDQHINFNINAYLDQFREVKDMKITSDNLATHPSFFIRMQALIWFSMTQEYQDYINSNKKGTYRLDEIDQKIYESLNQTSGLERDNLNKDIYTRCLKWGSLKIFLNDKSFSKEEQKIFEKNFGLKDMEKIKSLLKISNPEQIEKKISGILKEGSALMHSDKNKLINEFKNIINHYADEKNKSELISYFKNSLNI